MNPSVRARIASAARVILNRVDIDKLATELSLSGFLHPGELKNIRENFNGDDKWKPLLDVLQVQKGSFYGLLKALGKLGFPEIARHLNPIGHEFLQEFVLNPDVVIDKKNPTYRFDVGPGLGYTLKKANAGAEKIPVARLQQVGRPAFNLTAPQIAVFLGHLHQMLATVEEGFYAISSLGPERTAMYNNSDRPFNPADADHLATIGGNHANRLNLDLQAQEDRHPEINDLYDGFQLCQDNRRLPQEFQQAQAVLPEDNIERTFLLFFVSSGNAGHPLLRLTETDFYRLGSAMAASVKLLESLPEIPLPELIPSYISVSEAQSATNFFFKAMAYYLKALCRKLAQNRCRGCRQPGKDHTCCRETYDLLSEYLGELVVDDLSQGVHQLRIREIMFRITEPLVCASLAMAVVSDRLSYKFLTDQISDVSFLQEVIAYHLVHPIRPTAKHFDVEIFVNDITKIKH